MLEYSYLRYNAPSGVYVMPCEADPLRKYNGVMFIRSGIYRSSILHFSMDLPKDYPNHGARPSLRLLSPGNVFHPFVHPKTGEISLEKRFPEWVLNRDAMGLVLLFMKKIFYPQPDFSERGVVMNKEAQRLWVDDRHRFLVRVERCVERSVRKRFEEQSEIVFSEHKPQLDVLKEVVLRTGSVDS
eukprot:g4626.t1